MPNDPVCYTQVDEESKFQTTFKGQEYYFNTGFCKRKFDEEPDTYARLAGDLDIGTDLSCLPHKSRIQGSLEPVIIIRCNKNRKGCYRIPRLTSR